MKSYTESGPKNVSYVTLQPSRGRVGLQVWNCAAKVWA